MVWHVAYPHTDIHTDKKAKTEEALSGLSKFLPSDHNQGAVQQAERQAAEENFRQKYLYAKE